MSRERFRRGKTINVGNVPEEDCGPHERVFKTEYLMIPSKNDRLKTLQQKAVDKGLRGDEVFEFINLELHEMSQQLKEMTRKYNEAIADSNMK
jgi:hypothetical protein